MTYDSLASTAFRMFSVYALFTESFLPIRIIGLLSLLLLEYNVNNRLKIPTTALLFFVLPLLLANLFAPNFTTTSPLSLLFAPFLCGLYILLAVNLRSLSTNHGSRVAAFVHATLMSTSLIFYQLRVPLFFVTDRNIERMTSPIFGDPNYTAFSLIGILLVLNLIFSLSQSENILLTILTFVSILATSSLTALLSLLVASFILTLKPCIKTISATFMSLLSWKTRRKFIYSAIVIAVAAMCVSFASGLFQDFIRLLPRVNRILDYYQAGSLTTANLTSGRSDLFDLSVSAFNSYPLMQKLIGAGTSSYVSIVSRYAHNTYLEILLETGVVGLTVFILYLLRLIYLMPHFSLFATWLSLLILLQTISLSTFYKPHLYLVLFAVPGLYCCKDSLLTRKAL